MEYLFSGEEIGFWSIIFQHPLPLVVVEPFENTSNRQLEDKWDLFIQKFSQNGLIQVGVSDEITIDEQLTETLMCCFAADTVISIIENDRILGAYYLLDGKRVILANTSTEYIIRLFEHEDEFKQSLLTEVQGGEERYSLSEEFEMQISAEQFEEMLDWYEHKENSKISDLCSEVKVDYEICKAILDDTHREIPRVFLTERIGIPGTILTKCSSDDGVARLIKSIYTESGDIVSLIQCQSWNISNHLIDFKERRMSS